MSKRFEIVDTALPGLKIVQRQPISDARGYLERMFCAGELQALVQSRTIAQINHTATTQRGAVRGMHFQRAPHAEMKLVSCLRGEVFDVAVDVRQGSPTLLRWHAEILSAENHRTLLIPEGFAHGFQTLSADCELLYLHTAAYEPSSEGGLNPRDPRLAIRWPQDIAEMSARDAAHPLLGERFEGIGV
jgi:dTDP-4-dehydrorhamnose 3,5-epimerase